MCPPIDDDIEIVCIAYIGSNQQYSDRFAGGVLWINNIGVTDRSEPAERRAREAPRDGPLETLP